MNNEEKNIPKALINPNPEGNNVPRRKTEESNNDNSDSLPEKKGLENKEDNNLSSNNDTNTPKGKSKSNSILNNAICKALGISSIQKLKLYLIIAGVAIGAFILFFVFAYLAFAWNTFMTSIVTFFGIKEGEKVEVNSNNTAQMMSTSTNTSYKYEGLWYEYVNTENEEPIGLHDYEYPDGTHEEGLITMLKKDEICRNVSRIEKWFSDLWTNITGNFGNDECRLLNYVWGQTEGYEKTFADYGLNIDENMIIATIFYGYDQQAFYSAYKDPSKVNHVSASNMHEVLENIVSLKDENGKPLLQKEDVDKIVKNTIYEDVWPYWVFDIITRYKPSGAEGKDFKWAKCYGNATVYWMTLQEEGIVAATQYILDLIDGCASSFSASFGGSKEDIRAGNPEAYSNMRSALRGAGGGEVDIDMRVPLEVGICRARTHVSYHYEPTKLETFLRFNNTTNLKTNTALSDYGITGYVELDTNKTLWETLADFLSGKSIPKTLTAHYTKGTTNPGNSFDSYILGYTYEQEKNKDYASAKEFYGYGMTYDENMNKSWLNTSAPCISGFAVGEYAVDYMEKRGYGRDEEEYLGISAAVPQKFFKDRNYSQASTSTLEGGPVTTFLYTQRINNEDLYTLEEINIADIGTRLYCERTGCLKKNTKDEKTEVIYEINYEKGFAYEEFPGFKTAAEDPNIDDSILVYKWDNMSTPKKVELLIQNISDRKKEFAEVLETDLDPYPCDNDALNLKYQFPFCEENKVENDRKYDEDDYETLENEDKNTAREVLLTTKAYCDVLKHDYVGQFQVIITDCQDNYITSTSFKEYIMGVTFAEIGYVEESSLDHYVLTQMVAAISYTLGRHKNFDNRTFIMKSGSCDQNWCDIFKGCSRSTEGGVENGEGDLMFATFPGTHNNSTTHLNCSMKGYTAKNYWKCPMQIKSGIQESDDTNGMEVGAIERYSKLFDTAIEYYIVSKGSTNYLGEAMEELANSSDFNGAYAVTQHNEWLQKAKAGMHFIEILRETYPDSEVLNCDIVEEKGTCVNFNFNYDPQWNAAVLEAASILANDKNPIIPDMDEDNRGGDQEIGDCSTFVERAVKDAIVLYEKGFTSHVPPFANTKFKGKTMAYDVKTDIASAISPSSTYEFKNYGRCNCSSPTSLMPGDIVFYRTNEERWGRIGHVAIFAGYDEQGRQLVYEANTRVVTATSGHPHIPALVVDSLMNVLAGYSRWYPPAMDRETCMEEYP